MRLFTKRSAENPLSQPIIRQGKNGKINRFFFYFITEPITKVEFTIGFPAFLLFLSI